MVYRSIDLQRSSPRPSDQILAKSGVLLGIMACNVNNKDRGGGGFILAFQLVPSALVLVIHCFCRTPAYPARYIFSTPLLLGVVCHVNFARLAKGGRAGLLTHCHRPASSLDRAARARRGQRERGMRIWPTPMKGLTRLPPINMLIVFETRDSAEMRVIMAA